MSNRLSALTAAFLLLTSLASFAQATRTWVSGVGDDVNPCSRTAPGKTFAGAISKTADKGEINVLDPGGFGSVTINKSITIDGGGFIAGVLVSGTNAIIVNAPGSVVVLKGLDINGVGTGLAGVKVLAAAEVRLIDCQLYGFTGAGVDFQGADTGAALYVQNCNIHDCAGGGVLVKPGTTTGTAPAQSTSTASLTKCSIAECGATGASGGVTAGAGATVYLRDVHCANITGAAISNTKGTLMTVSDSSAVHSDKGIVAGGNLYLTNTDVISNSGAGLSAVTGGIIYSARNNHVAGNTPDGAAAGAVADH